MIRRYEKAVATVALLALPVSVGAGLIFGLVPAIRASRPDHRGHDDDERGHDHAR